MHRGQIRIESEIGKGTTVRISFARRAEAQAVVVEPAA
jgi:signal transduction histidine kinase